MVRRYTIKRYQLDVQGMPCETCAEGSQSGLDWWEITRDDRVVAGALICYRCAARSIAEIISEGVALNMDVPV